MAIVSDALKHNEKNVRVSILCSVNNESTMPVRENHSRWHDNIDNIYCERMKL